MTGRGGLKHSRRSSGGPRFKGRKESQVQAVPRAVPRVAHQVTVQAVNHKAKEKDCQKGAEARI